MNEYEPLTDEELNGLARSPIWEYDELRLTGTQVNSLAAEIRWRRGEAEDAIEHALITAQHIDKLESENARLRLKIGRFKEAHLGVRPWVSGDKFSSEELEAAGEHAVLRTCNKGHRTVQFNPDEGLCPVCVFVHVLRDAEPARLPLTCAEVLAGPLWRAVMDAVTELEATKSGPAFTLSGRLEIAGKLCDGMCEERDARIAADAAGPEREASLVKREAGGG